MLTLRSELQLTDEQREQIKTIVQSHKQEIVTVAKPVVAKHRTLRDAVLADSADEKAIRSAADDLGHSIGDAAVLAAKIKGEVHKVLTTEQQGKIDDFRKHADAAVDEFIQQVSQAA
jgi:Spy/CpxP family protein refolding chaperone